MGGRLRTSAGVSGGGTMWAGTLALPMSTLSRLPERPTTRRVGSGLMSARRSSLSRLGFVQCCSSVSSPPCRTPSGFFFNYAPQAVQLFYMATQAQSFGQHAGGPVTLTKIKKVSYSTRGVKSHAGRHVAILDDTPEEPQAGQLAAGGQLIFTSTLLMRQ